MTEKAQAILQQAEQLDYAELELLTRQLNARLEAEHDKEGIRIAEERMAQAERGEVEMIPWDQFRKQVDEHLK